MGITANRVRVGRWGLSAACAVGVAIALVAVVPLGTAPAHAETNGVGLTPAMGWSTWSFIRRSPSATKVENEALALKNSGLASVGYDYVNLDDFWYQCPGSQGPNVDANGRWVTDTTKFPNSGSTNGIQVVANYVHSLGLKFGLYVTPGISDQAVAKNTPILGTSDTAKEIANGASENNYNCHGMQGIDYSKPGAQQFINSWADEFASWGVDYVKLDGVGAGDIPDVQAWSQALEQTGRPIHLELSNNLAISDAATWAKYSNGWRTGGDIECYGCESGGSSYPLTDWSQVQSRFSQVASWQPYGGPGNFNDYDSIEVGNGSNDGLTAPERQSQLSLWAMAASPLILGTDLTNLDSTDLGYLKNTAVIAVDQDAIDARRVVDSGNDMVYAKTEKNGDVIIGLFNYSSSSTTTDTVNLSSAGLSGSATATNLWTGGSLGTISGSYSVTLGPGAVQLIKAVPTSGGGSVTVQADAAGNTLSGQAVVASCSGCSDGHKVRFIGNTAANYIVVNNVDVPTAGSYTLTFASCVDGTRTYDISVNGGTATAATVSGTSWESPVNGSIPVTLNAGENTIKFFNDTAWAPDLATITVSN